MPAHVLCLLFMARMLQALKNLEARSPAKPNAPPPPPAANHLVQPPTTRVERVVEPPTTAPAVRSASPVTESIDALIKDLASLEVAIQDPPARFELGGFSTSPFVKSAPKLSAGAAVSVI